MEEALTRAKGLRTLLYAIAMAPTVQRARETSHLLLKITVSRSALSLSLDCASSRRGEAWRGSSRLAPTTRGDASSATYRGARASERVKGIAAVATNVDRLPAAEDDRARHVVAAVFASVERADNLQSNRRTRRLSLQFQVCFYELRRRAHGSRARRGRRKGVGKDPCKDPSGGRKGVREALGRAL